ncbi:MAG: transcriptional regulator [Kordiimonas sp.]|mgnify:CR=1 FL=1|nr:transcriptional regulator [Kordiimonas sp.]
MDTERSLIALSALAQDTRLQTFRHLVRAGEAGLTAGEIAEQLGVLQNTLSTNLGILHRAGMIRKQREGRSIRYFADFDGMRDLLAFLLEDCCAGDATKCQPLLDAAICS